MEGHGLQSVRRAQLDVADEVELARRIFVQHILFALGRLDLLLQLRIRADRRRTQRLDDRRSDLFWRPPLGPSQAKLVVIAIPRLAGEIGASDVH